MGAGDVTPFLTSHSLFLCSSRSGPLAPSPTLSPAVRACLLMDKAPLLLLLVFLFLSPSAVFDSADFGSLLNSLSSPGCEMNPKPQSPLSPTKKAVGNAGLGAYETGFATYFALGLSTSHLVTKRFCPLIYKMGMKHACPALPKRML